MHNQASRVFPGRDSVSAVSLVVLEPSFAARLLKHVNDRLALRLLQVRVPKVEKQHHAVAARAVVPHFMVERICLEARICKHDSPGSVRDWGSVSLPSRTSALPSSHWRTSSPTRMPQPSGTNSGKWQRSRILHGAECALMLDCVRDTAHCYSSTCEWMDHSNARSPWV